MKKIIYLELDPRENKIEMDKLIIYNTLYHSTQKPPS